MTERPCRSKKPAECRVHGTAIQIVELKRQAEQAMLDNDTSKYLDCKERIHILERKAAKALVGTRPRDAVHPVLVYGTLRPSGSNYGRFLKGSTSREQKIEIDGFTMYDGNGFPFLTKGDSKVTATLVHLDEESYRDVMDGLDFLEGFKDDNDPSNGYDRVLHTFEVEGKEMKAWLYVASPSIAEYVQSSLPVIDKGDWLEHDAVRPPPVRRTPAYEEFDDYGVFDD
jgi:gamma-glutamylcyclotransferase (GGCT)/AIG2-like uncharacterized protein YtfP